MKLIHKTESGVVFAFSDFEIAVLTNALTSYVCDKNEKCPLWNDSYKLNQSILDSCRLRMARDEKKDNQFELVLVKVRPSYNDKKLHVLRFLFPDGTFSSVIVKTKLHDLFPYGFFKPKIERYMIDYHFETLNEELFSCCNHDYLFKYLTSSKKIE